ncbi:hypothetical protein BDV41DRAFT_571204 [Aspergillus transmontanensis]|uniref:Uncharacterized protein n=1 Tax=Aspergillus transmontanensis TaxID=1034304 RepID=A0A5N6WFH3_9EURO|nr:hypothetical protein BDV41DRAFT_571204 [Aspergillus transmontanensis]
MRAEGLSHIITSTNVKSLGIVLQYSYTGQGESPEQAELNIHDHLRQSFINRQRPEVYIPRARADRLGCGVIRGEPELTIPDFTIGTQQEIVVALRVLDATGEAAVILKDILRDYPEFQFQVADIVAMSTKVIHHNGSSLVQIPAPSDNVHGFTTSPAGRRTLRRCLEDYLTRHEECVNSETKHILSLCRELSRYTEWDDQEEP